MTTPQFKPAIPSGVILSQDVEADYRAFTTGKPSRQRIALVVLEPCGASSRDTEKGRKTATKYEVILGAEVVDPHEVEQIRLRITELQQERGNRPEPDEAETAPLWTSDHDEERQPLLTVLEEWRVEQSLTTEELTDRWNSFHGGDYDARLEHAAPSHLREFAISCGALADTQPDGSIVPADDEDDDTPAVPAPPFTGGDQ